MTLNEEDISFQFVSVIQLESQKWAQFKRKVLGFQTLQIQQTLLHSSRDIDIQNYIRGSNRLELPPLLTSIIVLMKARMGD